MIPKETVILSSTDTTVGFLSQSAERLNRIKKRPIDKPYIIALPSLRMLQERVRIPKAHKKRLRNSQRQSFIFPDGRSYRIVRDPRHLLLLGRLGWAYTTSANPAGKAYDPVFATLTADIIVEPLYFRHPPSRIYRLGKKKIRRIR